MVLVSCPVFCWFKSAVPFFDIQSAVSFVVFHSAVPFWGLKSAGPCFALKSVLFLVCLSQLSRFLVSG